MRRRRTAGIAGITALLALAAVLLGSAAAFAHDSLVSADPAAGDTVTALEAVTLQFSDSPLGLADSNIIQVIGPDGRYYETACPSLDGPSVTTPVRLGEAGDYRVRWRIVSSDGHPVGDEYRFSYQPDSSAQATAGSKEPRCGSADSAPAAEAPAEAPAAPSTGLWIGIGIGAVVLIGVGLGVWLILRRPAPRE